MFSTQEFIEVSRKFVCVRLESYESKEHQDMVRTFLNGSFANTAFGILAPDGETRLSGGGRGPGQVMGGAGRRGGSEYSNEDVIEALNKIASEYRQKGEKEEMVTQDFHTFRQALNVSSADQRLLVAAVVSDELRDKLEEKLAPVFAADDVIGVFHLDYIDEEADKDWTKSVSGASDRDGLYVIQSDQFGLKGKVLDSLPLSANLDSIRGTLLAANLAFSLDEERKDYASHVSQGRREGVYFEMAMPYGEDRDGDGEIDHGGGASKSKSKGKSGKR